MILQLVEQVRRVVTNDEQLRVSLGHESTLDSVLSEGDEAIEEASNVEQADGSLVDANLSPCADGNKQHW